MKGKLLTALTLLILGCSNKQSTAKITTTAEDTTKLTAKQQNIREPRRVQPDDNAVIVVSGTGNEPVQFGIPPTRSLEVPNSSIVSLGEINGAKIVDISYQGLHYIVAVNYNSVAIVKHK